MRKLVRDQQTRLITLSSYTDKPHFASFKGRNGRGAEEAEGGEEEPGAGLSLLEGVSSFPSHLLPCCLSRAAASPGNRNISRQEVRCAWGEFLHAQQVFPAASSKKGNGRKMIRFSPSLKRLNISS